jgi:hypothetical protein
VRRGGGHRLQRRRHHLGDLLVADLARRSGTGLVGQTVQAVRGESLAPSRHGEAADPEPLGDGDVGHAIRREQHDLGAQRVAARGLPPPRPSLQLAAFGGVQGDPDSRAPPHPSLSDLPPGQRITASQPCIDISETGH